MTVIQQQSSLYFLHCMGNTFLLCIGKFDSHTVCFVSLSLAESKFQFTFSDGGAGAPLAIHSTGKPDIRLYSFSGLKKIENSPAILVNREIFFQSTSGYVSSLGEEKRQGMSARLVWHISDNEMHRRWNACFSTTGF